MKTYGGMKVNLHTRHEALGTHWIEGWVGPRAGVVGVVKRKISALTGNWISVICPTPRHSLLDKMLYTSYDMDAWFDFGWDS